MENLVCKMCGSTDIEKKEGIYSCQLCGTKFSNSVEASASDIIYKHNMEVVRIRTEEIQELARKMQTEKLEEIKKLKIQGKPIMELTDDNKFKFESISDGTEYSLSTVFTSEEVLVIPEVFNGLAVTKIGNRSLNGCSNLKQIEIPLLVIEIGNSAFGGCKSLEYLELPPLTQRIGYFAFSGCENLKKLVMPPSVTIIDNFAFRGCTNLCELTIPSQFVNEAQRLGLDFENIENVTII